MKSNILTPSRLAAFIGKYLPRHFEIDVGLYPGYEWTLAQVVQASIGCRSDAVCKAIAQKLEQPSAGEDEFYWPGQVYSRVADPFDDYSLKRWGALTRFLDDAALPIDNNHDEQQIRPWATGRKNWLFAGTLMAGQRAAAIMSLIQSAKLNGHDPYLYLRDVLARLPTHPAREIDALLPHRWIPAI